MIHSIDLVSDSESELKPADSRNLQLTNVWLESVEPTYEELARAIVEKVKLPIDARAFRQKLYDDWKVRWRGACCCGQE